MISPFMPHLAEELFHSEFVLDSEDNNRGKLGSAIGRGYFSQRADVASIRDASWPADEEIGNLNISPKLMAGMSDALTIISQVRAYKSQQAISLNSPLERITVSCPSQDHAEAIQLLHKDLMGVTHAAEIVYEVNPAMNEIDVVPELFESAIQIVKEAKRLKKEVGLRTRDSIDEVKVICQSTEQMELLKRFLDYLRRGSRAEHVTLSIDEDIKKCKVAITV
jgi:valyl-tRNA synthetase